MKPIYVNSLLASITLLGLAGLVLVNLGPDASNKLRQAFSSHTENPFPALSAEMDEPPAISFDYLSDDVLLEICSNVCNITTKVEDNTGSLLSHLLDVLGVQELRQLSALQSLSMVNRRMRNLTTPILFNRIKIDGTWKTASRALKVVENCPAMFENVERFTFKVFQGFDVGPKPPHGLADRLAAAVTRMPKLKTLFIVLPEYHTDGFAKSFEHNKVHLPAVKTVVAGSFCDFVIRHCPNVEVVSSDGWPFLHSWRAGNWDVSYNDDYMDEDEDGNEGHGVLRAVDAPGQQVLGKKQAVEQLDRSEHALRLIKAAGKAKNVTHLELYQWWEARQVNQVYQHLPNLRTLAMPGGDYRDPPEAYLPTIGRFMALEELVLAEPANLNVDFDPPWCGNAYMGPGGDALARQVEEEGRQAAQSVALRVFNASDSLRRVWLGDHSRAEVERDAGGQVANLTWTYTARQPPNGRPF